MDPNAILTGLISALGGLLGLAGGLCACIVPAVFLIILGIFLYRRSQQGQAAKQAAQSWPGVMGTVLSSSVQSRRTGNSMSTYPVVVYQYQVNRVSYQGKPLKQESNSSTSASSGRHKPQPPAILPVRR